MTNEVWKIYCDNRKPNSTAKNCGCLWEVSNLGNVKRNGELLDFSSQQGYYMCGIGRVHRLVAELFVPNPDNKSEIDHIDGNKHNNRADNLRWVDRTENMANPITRKRMKENQPDRSGSNNSMFNHVWTDEQLQNLKEGCLNRDNTNIGKYERTDEIKMKTSIANKGKPAHNKGKHMRVDPITNKHIYY